MFVGEAPGRLGADASGIPFHGDKTGHNFEELLLGAGLSRASVFITNAVLCNPRDASGRNATPQSNEIVNCSEHLRAQIDLVKPRIVVTLGATALEATRLLNAHSLSLREHVRTAHRWFGRTLIPLYHPGQRAMIHRSYANQRSDYRFVAENLRRLGVKLTRTTPGKVKADVMDVASAILGGREATSYFALHKLLYLVEWEATQKFGAPATSAFFLRQKDGPYCVDLHLAKLRRGIATLETFQRKGTLYLRLRTPDLFDQPAHLGGHHTLRPEVIGLVDQTLSKYGQLGESELKTRVYLTKPMRQILRHEEATLSSLYNVPIDLRASHSAAQREVKV
jgi:uracil-DNA glycosylase family 4